MMHDLCMSKDHSVKDKLAKCHINMCLYYTECQCQPNITVQLQTYCLSVLTAFVINGLHGRCAFDGSLYCSM